MIPLVVVVEKHYDTTSIYNFQNKK